MVDLAVLVPTVNRADLLENLVTNIHETTVTPHVIYLIIEVDDPGSWEVARHLDAVCVAGDFGSNAAAVNNGYWASTEPFVAIVNDDCRFIPGWDTIALSYMSDQVHIVGINQGDGRCQSFSMVRRAFIEKHSGVYDAPNTLYHEYASQFPDTEFAEYAQHRGVWADAPDSVIEHLHWVFGKGDPDHPNYVKARDTFAQDSAVYEERRRQWAA
jgi:hypothetical protein